MRAPNLFWEKAAKYVKETSNSSILREQLAVRQRVQLHLAKNFKSVEEAEQFFGLTVDSYLEDNSTTCTKDPETSQLNTPPSVLLFIQHCDSHQLMTCIQQSFERLNDDDRLSILNKLFVILKTCVIKDQSLAIHLLSLMSDESRLELADKLVKDIADHQGIDSNPGKFVSLSLQAMKRLQDIGKSNIVYKFSQAIALDRPGSQTPLMPLTRMPFGLIQYNIEFFTATNVHQVCQIKASLHLFNKYTVITRLIINNQ